MQEINHDLICLSFTVCYENPRLIQNSLRKSSDALDQVSNPMLIWNVVVKELARKAS